jgi:hypothetical protein
LFLKFISDAKKFEIIKCEMVKMNRREKADEANADMAVDWML